MAKWSPRWRLMRRLLLGGLVLVLLLQLVPLGAWQHDNPPIQQAAVFDDSRAESLARAACFDCHSHEVRYPPHAYVAPISWLVRRDVVEGRDELNFSDFDPDDAEDAAEAIAEGEMPPLRYTLIHPSARMSQEEEQVLVAALTRMAGDAEEEQEDDD